MDIAQATALSPATVTALSSDLLSAGLIEEAAGDGSASRGRPRVLLQLKADALNVVGAKLSDQAVTVAVLNFAGEIVATAEAALTGPRVTLAEAIGRLAAALDAALAEAGLRERDVSALGLGAPGFVEMETGRNLWSPVLTDPAPIDIGGALAARFRFPVFVDNDANLATLAELWFGLGVGRRDFVVVTIEHGVGMGVVLDGRLFRGARGVGAEFGHTKVQNDGALCRCGRRGCLEAYVADYALAREAGAALGPDAARGDDLLDRLFARAEAGDPAARSIFRRAGRMLGLGVANLITIFDPPLVILAGERMRNEHLFAEEMRAAVAANTLALDRPPAAIRAHRWGDRLWARGAGALALEGIASGLGTAIGAVGSDGVRGTDAADHRRGA